MGSAPWAGTRAGAAPSSQANQLSALRDAAAARRPFRKALSDPSHPQPRFINTDQACLSGSAMPGLKEEGALRRRCRHRPVQNLSNILEQDQRAIKRRVKAKQSFREFQAARRTIQRHEAMHMIRKGQARRVSGNDVPRRHEFIGKRFDLPARDLDTEFLPGRPPSHSYFERKRRTKLTPCRSSFAEIRLPALPESFWRQTS